MSKKTTTFEDRLSSAIKAAVKDYRTDSSLVADITEDVVDTVYEDFQREISTRVAKVLKEAR